MASLQRRYCVILRQLSVGYDGQQESLLQVRPNQRSSEATEIAPTRQLRRSLGMLNVLVHEKPHIEVLLDLRFVRLVTFLLPQVVAPCYGAAMGFVKGRGRGLSAELGKADNRGAWHGRQPHAPDLRTGPMLYFQSPRPDPGQDRHDGLIPLFHDRHSRQCQSRLPDARAAATTRDQEAER
jgi:hypothetical protein